MTKKTNILLGLMLLSTQLVVVAAAAMERDMGPVRSAADAVRSTALPEVTALIRSGPSRALDEHRAAPAFDLSGKRSDAPLSDSAQRGAPCQHRVDLYDYFGDGWTGNTLDVLVNGSVVLNHITLPSGAGPQSFNFMAATGDTIRTIYHASGSYPYENYYRIYDGFGVLLAQDGVPGQQQPFGITITGNCEPPPTGACCHSAGGCDMVTGPDQCTDGTFLGIGHTCLECVCSVPCPPNATPEPEPCGEYLDDGCNSYGAPLFAPISPGQTVCGTLWANGTARDTDWYQIVTTESYTFTWTVEGEMPVTAYVLQPYPNFCPDPWVLASGSAPACQPISMTSDCRPPNEYWLWVGPSEYDPQPCGRYTATLTCTPCYVPQGACCFPNGSCTWVTYQNCFLAGGHWQGENVPCSVCTPYCCESASRWCGYLEEYIARVQIGTIDNSSPCTNYGDYSALSTDLVVGASATLTVVNGYPVWPNDYCIAWIDYNHDYAFTPDESLGVIKGAGPYRFTALPPITAALGPTRLRIVLMPDNPEPAPCGSFAWGEVEDYTIELRAVEGACCHPDTHTCTFELPSTCSGTYGGPFTQCAGTDCNQNGMDDFCDIVSGFSADCNHNGIPDECEPSYGLDCNGNGVPDFCDIANGTSPDCNGNGIPDECDIAQCPAGELWCADCNGNGVPDGCEAAGAGSYVHELDDGTHENTIGLTQGGYCAWLNHFVIADTNVRIDSIRLAYGTVPNGTPVTVYLWSDPDQDGDPHDARVLASASAVVANADRDVFNPVSIPPTYVGSAGRHFFVGAIVHHGPGQLPASLDQSTSAGQSWLAGGAESLDPNGLGKAPVALKLVDNYAFGGNWLIRAEAVGGDCNHNGIPDECDIASGSSHDQNGNGVPDECEPRPGDLNCDGRVDFGDINPFVLALIGQTQYESTLPACRWLNADCNSDELVNFGDINPFVACLTAGGCR